MLSVHVFTLNEDGPSMLTLEEDEELSAANHWLLPAGETLWAPAVSPDGGATATIKCLKL